MSDAQCACRGQLAQLSPPSHGQPIKAICRELGVSRKVVRKVIQFRYERETQLLLKIGPWSAELDRLLAANESKAVRERLTPIRLFEELCRRL